MADHKAVVTTEVGAAQGETDALRDAAHEVLDVYEKVASGETRGAGGVYYADGKGTLNAVMVPVRLLEELARATGRVVYDRTNQTRAE